MLFVNTLPNFMTKIPPETHLRNPGPLDSSLQALQVAVAPPTDENTGKTASVFQLNKSHHGSPKSPEIYKGCFSLNSVDLIQLRNNH